ncbi:MULTISPECIES: Imm26 family immunity protein [unclassified Mesorhizobium]|uniref:Imm26 family immunity protein n=1 Tax=unclassified Mesorhizobium TaxID=325217 RepID=UPI001125C42F|nr:MULTISPECIES: Imm26 family immunity protein [unclassified Mesorhizobium]MBZ9765608.1 immunity 26/phosphotriesterase HocA family protein [Mesorhizobium sp. CA6]MBZ9845553.1 immunity 26/phosphotriesterase HocA family protein [Mesorhizobium sp. CA5]TPI72108.1 hypothetical protein FJ423_27820 [Mesorhizobium sp. B2-8-9]
MRKMPYREGTLFAIPLKSGGYGVGLVARATPTGKIILVYLFGPRRLELPTVDELDMMSPHDAIRCLRCGDLGLINGNWPIIGQLKRWEREKWPTPPFVHKESLSGRILIRKYSDSDPSKLEGQAIVDSAVDLEPDGLHGYEMVELILTEQLKPH